MYLIIGMCIPSAKAPNYSLTAPSSAQRTISRDSGHLCEAVTRSIRGGVDSERLSVDVCFLLACGTYLYSPANAMTVLTIPCRAVGYQTSTPLNPHSCRVR